MSVSHPASPERLSSVASRVSAAEPAAVEVDGLRVRRGNSEVLHGLSLRICAGRVTGLQETESGACGCSASRRERRPSAHASAT
jgi:hypothetical protein